MIGGVSAEETFSITQDYASIRCKNLDVLSAYTHSRVDKVPIARCGQESHSRWIIPAEQRFIAVPRDVVVIIVGFHPAFRGSNPREEKSLCAALRLRDTESFK